MPIRPKKDKLAVTVYTDTLRETKMLAYMSRKTITAYVEEALRTKNKYERRQFTKDGAIEPEPVPSVPSKPAGMVPETNQSRAIRKTR